MSKYVKNLIAEDLRQRLANVHDALLVSVVGLNANATTRLRAELRSKGIELLVVKNSLAVRATAGTRLAPMFEGVAGSAAVCFGGDDIVALAKEVIRLAGNDAFKAFEPRGGVIDGERITAPQVAEVSKWPSRVEQLSILMGQILAPGARLGSQLLGPGGALASQIEQCSREESPPEEAAAATEAAGA
jgi:large subunit ribosomal protein L10